MNSSCPIAENPQIGVFGMRRFLSRIPKHRPPSIGNNWPCHVVEPPVELYTCFSIYWGLSWGEGHSPPKTFTPAPHHIIHYMQTLTTVPPIAGGEVPGSILLTISNPSYVSYWGRFPDIRAPPKKAFAGIESGRAPSLECRGLPNQSYLFAQYVLLFGKTVTSAPRFYGDTICLHKNLKKKV